MRSYNKWLTVVKKVLNPSKIECRIFSMKPQYLPLRIGKTFLIYFSYIILNQSFVINNILILIKKSKTLSRKTRRSRKRRKKKKILLGRA